MTYKLKISQNIQLRGRDGEVNAGTIVRMFKSMFLATSILAIMRSPDWNFGDEVVLDYRPFEKSTLKIFVDALYNCNVDQVALAELLKLLQFMSRFGFAEISKGTVEFACSIKK